jgi:hypothetical protein
MKKHRGMRVFFSQGQHLNKQIIQSDNKTSASKIRPPPPLTTHQMSTKGGKRPPFFKEFLIFFFKFEKEGSGKEENVGLAGSAGVTEEGGAGAVGKKQDEGKWSMA